MKQRLGIAELCAQIGLPGEAQRKLAALLELLATDPGAPTSVTDPAEAVEVHLADSLSALPLISSVVPALFGARPQAGAIVDIGSGAGLPGLPLAVALEHSNVDLVESTGRKCKFLSRAIERLEQDNARAVCMRAEDWARADGAGRYGLAVARAVAPLATLVEYASPLLTEGGFLIAWKGARQTDEERRAERAARSLGMEADAVHPVIPFPGSRQRHLHLYEKRGPTPAGVPRRAGMARKRPLGER